MFRSDVYVFSESKGCGPETFEEEVYVTTYYGKLRVPEAHGEQRVSWCFVCFCVVHASFKLKSTLEQHWSNFFSWNMLLIQTLTNDSSCFQMAPATKVPTCYVFRLKAKHSPTEQCKIGYV